MATESLRMDPDYVAELERQLELRQESLNKLKQVLAEKEELLLAATEKFCASEKRKVELESIFSANKPVFPADSPGSDQPEEPDSFVSSNFRAARLESENNALKSRLVEIVARVGGCLEAEASPENRLQDLNNFGLGVLSSFGLSTISPKLVPTCDALLTNGTDSEGLRPFPISKHRLLFRSIEFKYR